jgi:hypothetical protein
MSGALGHYSVIATYLGNDPVGALYAVAESTPVMPPENARPSVQLSVPDTLITRPVWTGAPV